MFRYWAACALFAGGLAAQVPEFVTGDECLFCHRTGMATTWQQNAHARTVWPNEKGEVFLGARQSRPLKLSGYGKFDILEKDGKTWNHEKFAKQCAGCHTTAVNPKTLEFATSALDCYTCHGVVDMAHTDNTSKVRFSKKYPKNPLEITSVCASCHLRGGYSKSSGLPYPTNFIPGQDLFKDYQIDLKQADNSALNPGDRHIYKNVRDVLQSGSDVTCVACHVIHTPGSTKHRRVLTSPICADCHNETGPKSMVRKYEVHSPLCEY